MGTYRSTWHANRMAVRALDAAQKCPSAFADHGFLGEPERSGLPFAPEPPG